MNSWFSIYWGAVVGLLPYYIRANEYNDVRVCKNYALFAAVCSSYLIFGIGFRNISSRIKYSLIGLSVLSWFNHDNFYLPAAVEQTVTFNVFLLLIYQLLSHDINFKVIANFLRISALIQCAFLCINIYKINPYNLAVPLDYPVGSFGQQTLSGAHVAVLFPFFLTTGWIVLAPILVGAVYISQSAMSLAALIVGLVVMIFHKHLFKGVFIFGSLITAVIVFFLTKNYVFFSDNMRYAAWSKLMLEFKDWPLNKMIFGRGFGYLYHNFHFDFMAQIFTYAHEEWIELLFALGFIGIFIFIYLIREILSFNDSKHTVMAVSVLAAVLANSTANFTLHISSIALIAAIAYAYLVQQQTKKERGLI